MTKFFICVRVRMCVLFWVHMWVDISYPSKIHSVLDYTVNPEDVQKSDKEEIMFGSPKHFTN